MPELPEVETTRRGIAPHIEGQVLGQVIVNEARMRWPVSPEIEDLEGCRVVAVRRRAKYLLLDCAGKMEGTLIIHLGMSGSLRLIRPEEALRKHDHVQISLGSGLELRYHDPRRFGCLLWTARPAEAHPLICDLGPEPLSADFTGGNLARAVAGRKTTIKQAIMDGKVVVGVGNIYACEALFSSGIHPGRMAARVSRKRLDRLVDEIKRVLQRSITQGGTTLRDFLREDGTAGYFKQQLSVYDREGNACLSCGAGIKRVVMGQRSTFYCPKCQR